VTVDFLRTVLHYASVAWSFIAGIPSDIGQAFDHVWRFVGSLYSLVAHMFSRITLDVLSGYLSLLSGVIDAIAGQNEAIARSRAWIYRYYIVPLRSFLISLLLRTTLALLKRIDAVRALAILLYIRSLSFTVRQVAIERSARIADVRAARAYALNLVTALHSAIEAEAARAYDANTKTRESTLMRLIDEIAHRNPVLRALVSDMTAILVDLLETDNPLLRVALNFILPKIISKLGVDHVLGELMLSILGPLAGTPKPKTLGDAIGDLARRVSAMEDRWTEFMVDGGPEIEQAGEQWKTIGAVSTNIALLGFFGLAVTDPAGWGKAIADTAGAAVNDSAAAVARLIRNA
jgi:hypothetical protein